MNDLTAQKATRGSLIEVPWYLALAVWRLAARQLDERRVRRLEEG